MTHLQRFTFVFLTLAFFGCEPDYDGGSLPLVRIQTESDIRPEPKVGAEMEIEHDGKTILKHRIGIEFRGSTSYRLSDKKSYGFSTWNSYDAERDITILGLPPESDWILMGHVFRPTSPETFDVFDPSLMHHYLGYELARATGRYASRCRWVELEIDGEYQGVYILMEKLKADNFRIDINDPGNRGEALTGGYILKIDKATGSEVPGGQPLEYYDNNWHDDATYTEWNSFRSNYDINGQTLDFEPYRPAYHPDQYLETYYMYEKPGRGDMSADQRNYIEGYIHDFETAILNDNFIAGEHRYHDFIDLESFADFFLVNELAANVDAYRLSTFLFKPRGQKLQAGPVWDLNIGYGRAWRTPSTEWIVNYNQYVSSDPWMVQFWWPKLLDDPAFRAIVKDKWTAYRAGIWSDAAIMSLVNENADRLRSTGAYERNYERWRATNAKVDYEGAISYLKQYLENRLAFMDSEIGSW